MPTIGPPPPNVVAEVPLPDDEPSPELEPLNALLPPACEPGDCAPERPFPEFDPNAELDPLLLDPNAESDPLLDPNAELPDEPGLPPDESLAATGSPFASVVVVAAIAYIPLDAPPITADATP